MIRTYYNSLTATQYDMGMGRFSALLKKNKKLKDSAQDVKRCFILATGPSIQTQNLGILENEYCISVSNFFVHPLFNTIKPHYHIFAATHPPITKEQIKSWWTDAEQQMKHPKPSVLLYAADKKIVQEYNLFPGREIIYYANGGRYPVDFTSLIPPVQTVVHIAIYLAIYIGIKEVYLLGCEHSWLRHFGESKHFYQEKQHAFTRANYSEWSEIKDMGEEFKTYVSLWDIYRKIRQQAFKNDVMIYNATPESMLDIFPRRDFDQIFK